MRKRLKEIRLVNRVNGKCPRWVNVDVCVMKLETKA